MSLNELIAKYPELPLTQVEDLHMYLTGTLPFHAMGSFIRAVIRGQLVEAAQRADTTNLPLLHIYARFVYNEFPMNKRMDT